MREEMNRLQTQLFAEMDSKLEAKVAPIRERADASEKVLQGVTEAIQTHSANQNEVIKMLHGLTMGQQTIQQSLVSHQVQQ